VAHGEQEVALTALAAGERSREAVERLRHARHLLRAVDGQRDVAGPGRHPAGRVGRAAQRPHEPPGGEQADDDGDEQADRAREQQTAQRDVALRDGGTGVLHEEDRAPVRRRPSFDEDRSPRSRRPDVAHAAAGADHGEVGLGQRRWGGVAGPHDLHRDALGCEHLAQPGAVHHLAHHAVVLALQHLGEEVGLQPELAGSLVLRRGADERVRDQARDEDGDDRDERGDERELGAERRALRPGAHGASAL